ncbi:MAG TPA: toll/interleukin-1 receptor domain-containing protein [Allosphingosinicella sp.]|nr:toll/interleukin-1 receptor domain-containing protein [Allosphingosinicella sp.]
MKNAFISWSGADAQRIAVNLKEFVRSVLPSPNIFVSSEDIPGGKPWFTEIARAIDDCNAGVIIITKASLARPWLHFEAGAIAKHIEQSFVIPLLCGVAPGDLYATPLAQFQALSLNRTDILKLCGVLSRALDYSEEDLQRRFDVWWQALGDELLDSIPTSPAGPDEESEPTVADISTQLEHLASAIDSMAADVKRLRVEVSPAIIGQGPLATASTAEAARLMQSYNLGDRIAVRPLAAQSQGNKVLLDVKKRRVLKSPPKG